MKPAAIPMRRAECVVLELALPERPAVPAGVLLLDPSTDRLYVKMRRDWRMIADEEELDLLSELAGQIEREAAETGGKAYLARLEDSLSNALRVSERQSLAVGNFESALTRLFRERVPVNELQFETHLPLYSCQAAAGRFGEHMSVEPEGWMEAPEGLRLTEDMFVAQVVGHSMEPRIPAGSFCIFRANPQGSRNGKLLLIENRGETHEEARYTIKKYESDKNYGQDEWSHKKITLKPLNPAYEAWELTNDDDTKRVIAEFVRVLD
jgi:phage repressor protein C with HTH and peptisase S24 domain